LILRFHELYFKNLLSFSEVKIKLDQTNIIVGPNNSGKTNVLRLLEIFSNNKSPLDVLRLHKNMKNDKQKESIIGFDIELTEEESKFLLQMIFRREISEQIPLHFRKIRILMKWENVIDDEPVPDYLIVRFENSLTAVGGEQLKFFGTKESDWKYLSNISLTELWEKGRSLDGNPSFSFTNKDFQDTILSRKFVDLAGDNAYFKHEVKADLTQRPNSKIDSDVFEFLDVKKELGTFITIWYFLSKILQNNIVIVKDTRPTIEYLADGIHKWRDENEAEYQNLKNDFRSLFSNTTFHLQKTDSPKRTTILISENGKNISLENSASGYFAGLYLLFTIYGEKETTLFFDEPETHFHPTKLMVVSNKLSELAATDRNQLTIITHSPSLLDFSMFQNETFNVIYMKREKDVSKVYQPHEEFVPKIISHHFDPSVFFERGCIIVEGPSDEYAMKAISDSYEQLLKKNSIALVNAGGRDQVEPFVKLLKEYGIPYVAMVDSDYNGFSEGVIKLDFDLESEFEKLGWKRKIDKNGKEKIRAEKAYSFIINYLKDESKKPEFEKSSFWRVIQSIIQN